VQLAAEASARGYRLERFETLASTNDEAMRRVRDGDAGRLWIVANSQSAGRGRLGRSWISPAGNLHASLLLMDPAPPEHLPELGFVCGVALAETLAVLAGTRIRLKWPNDALLDGAKLSGILLETARLSDIAACVAGIGVNCVAHPQDLPYPATDLAAAGIDADAARVFEGLSGRLAIWLDRWDRGAGFAAVRAAWLTHAAGLGEEIAVTTPRGPVNGRFVALDARGRLELEAPEGRIAIDAGDVFLAKTTAPTSALGRN
jgi:BirA family biotin operon repressor/biotin-[acetyl-CoA-carboxylase] ligase